MALATALLPYSPPPPPRCQAVVLQARSAALRSAGSLAGGFRSAGLAAEKVSLPARQPRFQPPPQAQPNRQSASAPGGAARRSAGRCSQLAERATRAVLSPPRQR
jgi:hypothetical protein